MSTVEVNKITPVSGGTSLQIGESGDTTNIVGTLQNNGASVGVAGISSSADATAITIDSGERVGINSSNMSSLDADANQLVVGSGSGDQGLTVYSDGSSSGSIFFANGTAGAQPKQGQIVYEQNNSTMLLKTANATAMSIDGSGRILKPLNVMFQAYASSNQSISNYSDNDVAFGGEDFDIGSNFASSTFTAPIAGKYVFMVRLQIADAVSNWIKVKLIPSGKQYQWQWKTGNTDTMCEFSQIVDMAASDTAKVTIVADDNNYSIIGDSGSTYHQSTFSGYLLG
tara:strand:- start:316 stop:1167 length:852 start_codon:yes stop_codon:yes gene_type:complete